MTEKLQSSLLEPHSFPFTAKAEKKNWSRDTKETEGEAISLLLRLINNNLMQGRRRKAEKPSLVSLPGMQSLWSEQRELVWLQMVCYTDALHLSECMLASPVLIGKPEAAILLVTDKASLWVREIQSVNHSGRQESPLTITVNHYADGCTSCTT